MEEEEEEEKEIREEAEGEVEGEEVTTSTCRPWAEIVVNGAFKAARNNLN